MWRTSAVALAFIAQIGLAQAEMCEPLPTGGLLCEQEGALLLVDPDSGTVVDVTQEFLSALSGGAAVDGSTVESEASAAENGTFEDRLSGYCADRSCPAGVTGAIDGITGYIPSYQ